MRSETQTFIVAIVGLLATLISSGLGLYFTARARAEPMRQHLFVQQLALVTGIERIVGKMRTLMPMVIARQSEHHEMAREDFGVKLRQLSESTDAAAAILPTVLFGAVKSTLMSAIELLTAVDDNVDTGETAEKFSGCAAKSALVARTFLGVDELSQETAAVLGSAKSISRVDAVTAEGLAEGAKSRSTRRAT